MRKIAAVIIALGLLLVGGTAPANAETLYRTKGKATITAQGAPAGATVTKARITVKKGKKTVAKNKTSYRAKKGTYKVTSTVSYYFPAYEVQAPATTVTTPATTRNVGYEDIWTGTCTTTGVSIAQDNSTYYDNLDYLAGYVYMDYAAHCPSAYYYDSRLNRQSVAVDVLWREQEYIFNDDAIGDKTTDILNDVDVLYVGQFTNPTYKDFTLVNPVTETITPATTTTTPGARTTVPATGVTTVKNTRTVVVR